MSLRGTRFGLYSGTLFAYQGYEPERFGITRLATARRGARVGHAVVVGLRRHPRRDAHDPARGPGVGPTHDRERTAGPPAVAPRRDAPDATRGRATAHRRPVVV